jgi:uncharacterized protein (DUF1015 family)
VAAALRARRLAVRPATASTPAGEGVAVMLAAQRWWRVRLADRSVDTAVERTDVARLQEQVLAPVLGITDPRSDPRLGYVPSSADPGPLVAAVGRDGVGFRIGAPSVGDMLAVARTAGALPPKSTYVHPKARSGVLLVSR